MADNEIGLKLKVDFDVDPRKINVVINSLKNSLGPLGKDIKPIDGDKIAAELNKIQAETTETVTGLNAVDTALKNTGGSSNNLLKTAFTFNQIQQSVVGLTSAMSPFIDEFIELDKNIKNIGTLGRKDFEEFSAISLKLAADIPGTAADMANGIYQAISAGAQGTAQEIGQFVEVAAKAGVAGLSDTTTAVNGLTSVLNAYGRSYDEANEVADTFFAGIKLGKCVVGSTRVLLSDGSYKRIDELQGGAEVVSFDGRTFVPMDAEWIAQGTKPTVRLKTHLGREIVTTWNHPYLTKDGWKNVSVLKVGERIAVPTQTPFFGKKKVPTHIAEFLGFWLAEGSGKASTPSVCTTIYKEKVEEWASIFGCRVNDTEKRSGFAPTYSLPYRRRGTNENNPIIELLRSLGLFNIDEKFIPEEVFTWDRKSVKLVLRWLFNGDGWLCDLRKSGASGFQLGFCSKSKQLVYDVNHLLVRFGIIGRIRYREDVNAWNWETNRFDEIKRFSDLIGIDRPAVEELNKHTPQYTRAKWGVVEYDKIIEIEETGEHEKVYDLMVEDLHNFVANDIIAHNTSFSELNSSLASFIPSASAMEVGFDQATAAIARLTAVGTPTAQAGTQMNAAFTLLAKGTTPLIDSLKVVGTDLSTLREKLKQPVSAGGGLVNVFREIKTAADASGKQLAELTGSVEAAKIIESLAGSNEKYLASLGTYDQVTAEIAGGAASAAFDIASTSIQSQADGFQATISGFVSGALATLDESTVGAIATFNKMAPALSGAGGAVVALKSTFGGLLEDMGGFSGIGDKFKSTLLTKIIPSLYSAQAAETAAAGGAKAFFTALMFGPPPIGAIIAGIAAVGTALYFIVDALHESAEEQLENAKVEEEIALKRVQQSEAQIAQKEKEVNAGSSLIEHYEKLGKQAKETGVESAEYLKVQNSLIKLYPGVIDGTKGFEENLVGLKSALQKDKEEILEYNKALRENKVAAAEATEKRTKKEVNVVATEIQDQTVDELNDVIELGGNKTRQANIDLTTSYVEAIKNAKNDTELLKAQNEFTNFVLDNDDIDPEAQTGIVDNIDKLVEAQSKAIEAGTETNKQKYSNALAEINDEIKANPPEFGISDERAQQIADEFGIPVSEVKSAIGGMEKEARQSKVGEILGESSKIQGDIKKLTRLDDLVNAFNEAKTDAQRASIGDAIKEIAPQAIKSTGVIEDANGKLIDSYKILDVELDKVKESQNKQFSSDLLAKQNQFVDTIAEEGEKYRGNRAELDKLKAEISEKKKLGVDTTEAEAQFKKLSDQNKASIGEVVEATAKLASQGEVSNEVYAKLGKEFGVTGDEMKIMVENAKGLTSSLEESIASVEELGASFKGALEGAGKAQSDGVAAIAELDRQLREGEIDREFYEKRRKEIFVETKKNVDELKRLKQGQKDVEIELGITEEKRKKTGKDLYTITKAEYDLISKSLSNEKDKADLEAETIRIREGRKKTVADEIVAEERTLDLLEKQKLALKERFKISEDANGNIDVGLAIKKDQKEKVTQDYERLLIDINKADNKKFELEAKITADEESLVQLRIDLKKQDLEYNLKTAIDDDSKVVALDKLKEFYQDQLKATEDEIKDTQSKLDTLNSDNLTNAQRLEKVELEKHLAELKKNRIANEDSINSQIKSIQDIRLNAVKDYYAKEVEALENSLNSEQELRLNFLTINDSVAAKIYDDKLAAEIAQIDREEELRGISLSLLKDNEEEKARLTDYYNQQRIEKEKEYTAKKQAIAQFQQGYELELKNDFELQKLRLQEESLKAQIDTLQQTNPGSEELKKLHAELSNLTQEIEQKADDFAVAKEVLGKGLADSLAAGFAGDTEKMKEGLRASLQVSAGALKAKAEAAITSLIFGQLGNISTLGIGALFLAPVIKAVISAGVNKLLNPVLTSLTSFSSGGRVDSPTLAWVGDASNARPGADTEWILRDDQLQFILNQATSSIVNRLVPSLVGMNASLYNAVSKFTDMMMAIGPKMAANNISLFQVTNYFQDRVNANTFSNDTVADANTMKQLKKQNFKIRRFATGLSGGAITEPELILAGDTNVPEYVVRQDQLNLIANSVPNNDKLEKKLDSVIEAIRGIHFIIDKETIGQAANKYNNERNVNIKG